MAKKSRTRTPNSSTASLQTEPQSRPAPKRSLVHAPIEEDLVAAILAQMPFRELASGEIDREVIFASYIDSLAMINTCRQELTTLCEALATTSVTYESPLEPTVCQEIEQSLKSDFRVRFDPPVNIAGAELGAMPVQEIREHLSQALNHVCQTLIVQFIDGLQSLLDRQLLGIAHWPGQNAVKYRYYRHLVRGHASVTKTTTQNLPGSVDNDRGSRWIVTKHLRREIQATPVDIYIECHHHDAIDAFCTSIENSTVVMPADVKSLLKAIPSWMRPSIRIIDGYLIRERVDQKKSKSTSVITNVTEEVVTDYQLRRQPGFFDDYGHGPEPAVLLGRIVLTGWGPREIEQTKTALRQQEIEAESGSASTYWLICSLALQVPTACFLAGPGAVPRSFLLAAMLFIASVFCLAVALRNFLQHKATPVDELRFQALMAGPAVVLLGLLIALLGTGGFWSLPGLFIVFVGVALTHKIFSHLLPNFQL